MKTFSDELTDARKKSGLRQDDCAELLRVSQRTISNWEAGVSEPSKFAQESMLKIVRLFPNKKPKTNRLL